MTTLFNRTVSVDVKLRTGETITFTGIRITYRISKTITSSSNAVEVTLYNLSPGHRRVIREQGSKVTLIVGYLGFPGESPQSSILAIGDINFVDSKRTGSDWLTSISSGDGDRAIRQADINESFSAGTGIKQVIEKLVDKLSEFTDGDSDRSLLTRILDNINFAFSEPEVEEAANESPENRDSLLSQFTTDGIIKAGMTLAGNAAEFMDEITETHGMQWSIQNDRVKVYIANESDQQPAILLTPTTGMIGSPSLAERGNITLSTLTIAELEPGRKFRVESADITGDFKCISAEFTGDTFGEASARIEGAPVAA